MDIELFFFVFYGVPNKCRDLPGFGCERVPSLTLGNFIFPEFPYTYIILHMSHNLLLLQYCCMLAMRKGSILITGANGGLGSAFVSQFTNSPHARYHHGLYLVRDAAQAHTLKETLKEAPKDYTFTIVSIDLSSLFSVWSTANTLNTQISTGTLPPIRALILNAAVQHTDGKVLSKDGFESHFAVNYLANFHFVLLMLPSMDKQNGRIIGISSAMHDSYHWMNSGTFLEGKKEMYTETAAVAHGGNEVEDTDAEKKIAGMRRYGTSKLLLVMFMYIS
jgi:NAD(P)-dependent dehydrogenase (short-subunit alcohol dehydrogenase family)